MTNTVPYTKNPFASSILQWMRTDQPLGSEWTTGRAPLDISALPGFDEYRQLHRNQE